MHLQGTKKIIFFSVSMNFFLLKNNKSQEINYVNVVASTIKLVTFFFIDVPRCKKIIFDILESISVTRDKKLIFPIHQKKISFKDLLHHLTERTVLGILKI